LAENNEEYWYENDGSELEKPILKLPKLKAKGFNFDQELINVLDLYSKETARTQADIVREAVRQFIPLENFRKYRAKTLQ